LNYKLRK